MKIITLLIFGIVFLVTFYLKPLNGYFSQDDFFHLRQVMNRQYSDIPSFFVPLYLEGTTFYRPVSREGYNFLALKSFGLNPLPYHVINLILIVTIGALVFKLIATLTGNKVIGLLSTIIYLLNPIHNVELYYLSSVQTLLSTTFILSGVIIYHKYLKEKNIKLFFVAVGLLVISTLCHESAVIFPAILGLMELFFLEKKSSIKYVIYRMLFISLLLLPRLYIQLFVTGLPSQQAYLPSFSIKTISNSFGWFTLWSFGLPESLVDFVGPGLHLNNNFLIWYKDYVVFTFPPLAFILAVVIYLIFRNYRYLFRSKDFLLFIYCYVFSLSPFLFFPEHKFVYYLSLPVVWFSSILGLLFAFLSSNQKSRMFLCFIVICFGVISYMTSNFNEIAHWAAKRQLAAKFLLENFKKEYPSLQLGAQIYVKDDPNYPFISSQWGTSSKQAFYILSGSDAFQLVYKDQTIRAYYEGKDQKEEKGSIIYTARFPY